jgi:DNA-binding transcriptional LysR family regulator
MPLDVDRLRVFRTVATLGSFRAAARSLAYIQPGVSHHVKQLEREFYDQMAVCLPVAHPGASRGSLALEDLRGETWVAPYDSVCREAIEVACSRAGFTPRVVGETNDYMAMQGLVATGVGVAVMPRLVASIALRAGRSRWHCSSSQPPDARRSAGSG